ncbi:MAG: LysR family transcriptional regulator, partial [Pirellulaceae bacterium]|nr:LysR family transcriptional regulator [Pirellulaceae bacterium]
YVSDLIYSSTLEYAEPLEKFAAKRFECASLTSQLEVVRSGIGVGILHDYAARAFGDLVKILPSFSVKRNYWLVAHKDVRMIRRISFVHEFITSEFKNSGRGFFCPS